jgi:ABC-type multidrug transport system fused ATPase/permease subunit
MSTHARSLGKPRGSLRESLQKVWDYIRRHPNLILLIVSILLVTAIVLLVPEIIRLAFRDIFTCANMVGKELSLPFICDGIHFQIPASDFKVLWIIPVHIDPIPRKPFTIMDGLAKDIDVSLDHVRRFVSWNFIMAFAVASMVLAYAGSKVVAIVTALTTSAGRRAILGGLNLWLLIFAVLCGLFYLWVVAPSTGIK